MATVLNAPMPTIDFQYSFPISFLLLPARNAIGDFTGVFTGFFICKLTLDDKSLSDVRKVQIVVEFGGGPDFTDFDAAVIGWVAVDKIGLLSIFKI